VISPTGQYNHADDINPSSGFWSLNPFWAVTFLPTPNTEFSTRLQYLHNFQNKDPAGGSAPFRAGGAVWANFAASHKVLPTLNVGLNGYYFQQIQNDTVNGQTNPKSECPSEDFPSHLNRLAVGAVIAWTGSIGRDSVLAPICEVPRCGRSRTATGGGSLRPCHIDRPRRLAAASEAH
jgi:hypothetical protein